MNAFGTPTVVGPVGSSVTRRVQAANRTVRTSVVIGTKWTIPPERGTLTVCAPAGLLITISVGRAADRDSPRSIESTGRAPST